MRQHTPSTYFISVVSFCFEVLVGSPSRSEDVTLYVCDINQLSLPTPVYSVLVSSSVFMALSTVFHSLNSPNNSSAFSLCSSALFLPYSVTGPFNCLFMKVSLSHDIILCG